MARPPLVGPRLSRKQRSALKAKIENERNLKDTMERMEKWRIKETDDFNTRMFKTAKLASVWVQKQIDGAVDRPVPFTQRAIGYKATKQEYTRIYRIWIYPAQDQYLDALIDQKNPTDKWNPLYKKFLDRYGNIKQLRKRLSDKTLVPIKAKNREWLVDVTAKGERRDDRLVAVRKVAMRPHRLNWDDISNEVFRMVNNRVNQSTKVTSA